MRGNEVERILRSLEPTIATADRIITSTTPAGLRMKPIADELAKYLAASGIDNGTDVTVNGTTYIAVIDDFGDMNAAVNEAIRVSIRTDRDRITLRAPDPVLDTFTRDAPAIARAFELQAARQLGRDVRQLIREAKGDHSPLVSRVRHRVLDFVAEHPATIRNVAIIAISGGIMAGIMIAGYPVVSAVVGVGLTWFIRDIWDTKRSDLRRRDEDVTQRRQLSPVKRRQAIVDLGAFADKLEAARERHPAANPAPVLASDLAR